MIYRSIRICRYRILKDTYTQKLTKLIQNNDMHHYINTNYTIVDIPRTEHDKVSERFVHTTEAYT